MAGRLIVGLNLDETSKATLAEAQILSRQLGMPMVVVHVVSPDASGVPESAFLSGRESEWFKNAKVRAKERFSAMVGETSGAVLEVLHGWPEEQLVALAAQEDILLVGRKGQSCLKLWFTTNLAKKLSDHCKARLVIIPSK